MVVIGATCATVVQGLFEEIQRSAFKEPEDIAALAINGGTQIVTLAAIIFFFIALNPPQVYNRSIRMAGGVLFKKLGGIRRGNTQQNKTDYITG